MVEGTRFSPCQCAFASTLVVGLKPPFTTAPVYRKICDSFLTCNLIMDPNTFIDPYLTHPDLIVLKNLLRDIERRELLTSKQLKGSENGTVEHSNGVLKSKNGSVEPRTGMSNC
jgi:hypothetical protein